MIPQGSVMLNTQYFTDLKAKLAKIDACDQLQEAVNEAVASIAAEKAAVLAEIEKYLPLLELLSLDISDLPKIITFLTHFVEHFLTPYLQPYIDYATQLTALVAEITSLVTAIEDAASSITSCSITIPTIP